MITIEMVYQEAPEIRRIVNHAAKTDREQWQARQEAAR